jgi:flagellar basal-body rod protein FlgC
MNIFDIAFSGLFAERLRMDVISHNIANANTIVDKFGNFNPYRRKEVVFQEVANATDLNGVRVSAIVEDKSDFRRVYEPTNKFADKDGFVLMPNVNIMVEIANFINSSRTYQFNLTMIENAKSMYINTLRLLG